MARIKEIQGLDILLKPKDIHLSLNIWCLRGDVFRCLVFPTEGKRQRGCLWLPTCKLYECYRNESFLICYLDLVTYGSCNYGFLWTWLKQKRNFWLTISTHHSQASDFLSCHVAVLPTLLLRNFLLLFAQLEEILVRICFCSCRYFF